MKIQLKKIRESAGMTQKELSNLSGCPQNAISFWETGIRSPSAENLIRLASALQCSTDNILGVEPANISSESVCFGPELELRRRGGSIQINPPSLSFLSTNEIVMIRNICDRALRVQ